MLELSLCILDAHGAPKCETDRVVHLMYGERYTPRIANDGPMRYQVRLQIGTPQEIEQGLGFDGRYDLWPHSSLEFVDHKGPCLVFKNPVRLQIVFFPDQKMASLLRVEGCKAHMRPLTFWVMLNP